MRQGSNPHKLAYLIRSALSSLIKCSPPSLSNVSVGKSFEIANPDEIPLYVNIQLMHSFEVNIRICQPENSDVHRGEAEVNITFEG